MSHIIYIILGLIAVCAVLSYMILKFAAVEGYQDARGFHYGQQEEHDDQSQQ